MRILHVLFGGSIGGIERLCLDIAKRCPEHGFYFIEHTGELVQEFQRYNKNVFFSKTARGSIIKRIKLWAREIQRKIKNNAYKAVIFHHASPYFWIIARRLKSKDPELKTFLYAHGDIGFFLQREKSKVRYFVRKAIFKGSTKKVDGIIVISNAVKEGIINELPFTKDKIYVNYNGIDLEKFNPKKDSDFDKEIRLVYVGRLIEEKGVQNILQALADCRDMPVTLDIIGDGAYRKALEDFTLSLGLQGMVHFLGMQQDVANLLSNYNFFIHLPQCEEGFGITVAEALACGLICIVNDRGAMTELIQDGYNGFVLPVGQSYDLRRLFSDILLGNYDLKIMRENAVKSAQAFSINKTIEKLEEIVSV